MGPLQAVIVGPIGAVVAIQGGVPGGRAQELIHLGQGFCQAGEPGLVIAAGHGAVSGAVPNPAQAEVPGWAEYASSGTVTGPLACAAAW